MYISWYNGQYCNININILLKGGSAMTKKSIKEQLKAMDNEQLLTYRDHFSRFVDQNKEDNSLNTRVMTAKDSIKYIDKLLKERR